MGTSDLVRGALRPCGGRRGDTSYLSPPAGYRLLMLRAMEARAAYRRWGVAPLHVGHCRYALWVPEGPVVVKDSPLVRDARAWLEGYGRAAYDFAWEERGFGRLKILGAAESAGCPIPERYSARRCDVEEFLSCARALSKGRAFYAR